MAARRRTTLASVSSASLNSRGPSASSSRASLAPTRQTAMAAPSKPSRFGNISAGGGGRSISGRPSMGAARPSMGGGRPSMGSAHPSMGGGRPSIAGDRNSATGVRRSSAYGNGAGGKSVDSRPLMDKGYLNASLHKLADYLSSHGYDQPINNKNLSRPSGRDFNNIMGFIFRQFDANYRPSGRFEDDVVPILKMLRYPYTISRSSLAAVGAPQTWPKVMGVISWLVDYLLYEEGAASGEEEQRLRQAEATHEELDEDEEEGSDEQGADLKNHLDYLGEAYMYFLEGDDEADTALGEDYASAHKAEGASTVQRTTELEQTNERIVQEVQEIEEVGNSLPKKQEALKLALSDKEKYRQLLEQLKVHKQNIQEKIERRLEEERRLKDALVQGEDINASLRGQISRQDFSADDVERQAAERRRVKEAMHSASEAKAKARKEGWTAQNEVSKCKEMVKDALDNYESKARGLLLIANGSQPAKSAGNTNFEVSVDETKLDQENGILTNDIRGVIRPALDDMKVAVIRRTQELRQDLSKLLEEEDKVEEEFTDVENELEVLHKQIKRKEEMYNKMKYQLDQKVSADKQKVEDEERRLESIGAAEDLDCMIVENNALNDLARIEIEALKERQVMDMKQGESILHTALESALDHKEREERCLAGLKERHHQRHVDVVYRETPFDSVLAEVTDHETASGHEENTTGHAEGED